MPKTNTAKNKKRRVSKKPRRSRIVPQYHFKKPALSVARELIGMRLVRRLDGKNSRHIITETEAYIGPHDRACHASKGFTPRTMVMFGPPGRWYVYFTYGIHWMLNIVTNEKGHPAAVLIRSVEGIRGPARLTKTLKIDKALNGLPATRRSGLWIEGGAKVPRRYIRRTPRIGVGYAEDGWAEKPYRFVLDESFLERNA